MIINKSKTIPSSSRGFTIVESIIVMCVLVSLLSIGSRYITISVEDSVHKITAQQLKQVAQAAQNYARDNYQFLIENRPLTVDFQELINKRYLPSTIPKENQYGQIYTFKIDYDNKNITILMITDGGQIINESSLRKITSLAGSSAGYISIQHPDKITGFQESWQVVGEVDSPSSKVGHLATLTVINEKEVMDAASFLRRHQFSGHEEYNTMETDLTINNHSLKVKDGSSRITVSPRTITLQNPFEKTNSKKITLDVAGSPMLIMNDTYNKLGDVTSLLSGDRLEFLKKSNKNEIKFDNRHDNNPSLVINTAKKEIKITPEGVFIDGRLMVSYNYIKAPFHFVKDVDDPQELQSVADKLNCNNNEGSLFMVGDDSKTLKKRLLMCIWRPDTSTHNYIVVGEGNPWMQQ